MLSGRGAGMMIGARSSSAGGVGTMSGTGILSLFVGVGMMTGVGMTSSGPELGSSIGSVTLSLLGTSLGSVSVSLYLSGT